MQKANLRIQANALSRGNAIVGQQGIKKREQRIHRVARWPAISTIELERFAIFSNHAIKALEVGPRRFTFDAAQLVYVVTLRDPNQSTGENFGAVAKRFFIIRVCSLARAAGSSGAFSVAM